MAFEKFTQTSQRLNVSGSVSDRGSISFSAGAVHRFHINASSHAVLYFDRDTQRIGVDVGADETEPGARKVVMLRTGAMIRAKPFFDYFNIAVPGTLRMDLSRDDQSGIIVFDLSAAKQRKSSRDAQNDSGGAPEQ